MAVITSGLYKLTLKQTYENQVVFNTFWYESTLGEDDLQEECATAFDEDVLPDLVPVQHATLTYDQIQVNNVTGILADHIKTPSQADGDLVGTAANSFTCSAIRLDRTTKETRNGQKRFCGVTENVMDGQGWDAAYVTDLNTLAVTLSTNISTVGGIFKPVIARQDPLVPANWTSNDVAGATVSPLQTTQTSRKQGRGI